jgi:hypothetical protein
MGLPARQRRILEKIEHTLRGSDPRLTALFAIFSRLTRDEEMPRIEQLRASAALHLTRLQQRMAAGQRGPAAGPFARYRGALFFPLALLVVASTFVLAAAFPSSAKCPVPAMAAVAAATAAAATRHNASRATCKPAVISPVIRGR